MEASDDAQQASKIGQATESEEQQSSSVASKATIDVGDLKRGGVYGCELLFLLLPLELVAFGIMTLALHLIISKILAGDGFGGPMFLLIFGLFWHVGSQIFIYCLDLGGVKEALTSISEQINHDAALRMLADVRSTPPEIEVTAEAFEQKTVQSGGLAGSGASSTSTHVTVKHTERDTLKYSAWTDETPRLGGLQKYRSCEISVEIDLQHWSSRSQEDLDNLAQTLEGKCEKYASRTRSFVDISVPAPSFQVNAVRILSVREEGSSLSLFWSPRVYRAFTWGYPLGGFFYRLLYFICFGRRHVYIVTKIVSATPQDGPNWRRQDERRESFHVEETATRGLLDKE